MVYFEIAALLVGMVLLVVGYRRNRRNVLLLAAIVLFLAGAYGDLSEGFIEGFQQGRVAAH